MTLRKELAELLQTTEKKLDARLIGMKLAPFCGRCGGSGNYSFNRIDGSRCYGCNGKGHVRPDADDLPKILENAKIAVAEGLLEEYLDVLRARSYVKNASDKVFKAWRETSVAKANSVASITLGSDEVEGLAEVRAANREMHRAASTVTNHREFGNLPDAEKADTLRKALEAIQNADFAVPTETVERFKRASDDWQKEYHAKFYK